MVSTLIPSADLAASVTSRVLVVKVVDFTEGAPATGSITFELPWDVDVKADGVILRAGRQTLEFDANGEMQIRVPTADPDTNPEAWFLTVKKSWAPHAYAIRVPVGTTPINLVDVPLVQELPAGAAPGFLLTGAAATITNGPLDVVTTVAAGVANFAFSVPDISDELVLVEEERAAAEAAKIAAQNAAADAVAVSTGDLDPAAAVLVEGSGSALQTALDARFASSGGAPILDSAFTSLQAAVTATPPGRTLLVTKAYSLATTIVVNKPMTMQFVELGSITTTAPVNALEVSSSNVTIDSAILYGTGSATGGTAKGIHVKGSSGGRLSRIHITSPRISGFNKDGIWLDYVDDFSITASQISACGYSGIVAISCARGLIDGGRIKDITKPSGFINAYGVALTRDSTKTMAESPRSEDITVSNLTVENVPWEGIDTHAGRNLRFIGNTVLGCTVGIAMVACPDPAGVETWAPINMVCANNYVDARTSGGDKSNGIMLVGAGTTVGSPAESATGIVSNNIIVDHGGAGTSQAVWGGMLMYMTRGVVVSGNTVIRPGVAGICLYHTNVDAVLSNNVIEDTWTSTAATTAAVFLRSSNNTLTALGTQITRGSKTATVVNGRGLWINSTTANSVIADGSNRWSGATLPISGTGNVVFGAFGATPVTKPAGVPQTVAGLHAALVALGFISA